MATHDKSLFIKLLGDISTLKIIDFLIEHYLFDYSVSELAHHTKLHLDDVDAVIRNLLGLDVVVFVKSRMEDIVVGSAQVDSYILNQKDVIVKSLTAVDKELSRIYVEKNVLD